LERLNRLLSAIDDIFGTRLPDVREIRLRNALRRQTEEALPYVFVVLSVPDLNAGEVGKLVPDAYVWALALLKGKRIVEETIADRLRAPDYISRFESIFARMPEGELRVISVEKANRLLREKLFERVHALTVKGFTRTFRNAEVDMHFSLSTELTPVRQFLEAMLQDSPQKFAVRLYRETTDRGASRHCGTSLLA
jgi:hypothetical protein